MDERLIEIFKLVFLLNQKGKDLQLTLRDCSLEVLDTDFHSIIPHWTDNIYFGEFWKDDYDEMVNSTLEMLKVMLEGVENE